MCGNERGKLKQLRRQKRQTWARQAGGWHGARWFVRQWLGLLATGCALCLAGPLAAAPVADDTAHLAALIYEPPPVAHIDPVQHAPFSALANELRYLIYRHGDTGRRNHFCIVGYRFADGHQEAVVLWAEPNWLIRWWGSADPEDAMRVFRYAASLGFSKKLDLDTDLVETAGDIRGSTFLTVRARAEAVVDDCRRHGQPHRVEPFVPPDDEGGY